MAQSGYDTTYPYPYDPRPPSDVMKTSERVVDWDWPKWMPLIAAAGFGLLADFAVCPLMATFRQHDWGAVWVYMCFGVIAAQGAIAAVGLAWTRDRFLLRFALHWSAIVLALAVWAIGFCASLGFDPRRLPGFQERELWVALWIFPTLSLSIQVPLWLVSQYFGWRLVQCERGTTNHVGELQSIRDLLVGTLIVGFSMMAARIAASLEPSGEIWIGLGIAAASFMAVTTISVLPIGIWLLKWSNWQLGVALVALETVLGSAVTFGVMYSFAAFRSTTNVSELLGLTIVIGSFASMLSAMALAARAAGYRLRIGRLSCDDRTDFDGKL